MKSKLNAALAFAMAMATPLSFSADVVERNPPGPAAATSKAASNPSPPAANAQRSWGDQSAMDAQMKAMREMHEKMANAKTPQERQALMAEHMKAMQRGMSMMNGMMGGGASSGGAAMSPQAMQKQMEMMQMMMQMMMDRMAPPTSAK